MGRSRTYRALLLAGSALILCSGASPQSSAPHSTIIVHVHKSGVFSVFAHDHVITAPIAQGKLDAKAMTVQVTVAAKQMKVADPEASEKDRAEIQSTMLSPKVLDPDRYPEIRFTSSHIEQTSPQHYRVMGKLELHGVSRELSFPATGGPDRFHGKTGLKQTDFGIKPVSIAGGSVKVKDEVEVEFDVLAADFAAGKSR